MLHLVKNQGDEIMSSFQIEGQRAVIDIRERVLKGEHPRREILNFVKTARLGLYLKFICHTAENPWLLLFNH